MCLYHFYTANFGIKSFFFYDCYITPKKNLLKNYIAHIQSATFHFKPDDFQQEREREKSGFTIEMMLWLQSQENR